MNKIEKIIFYIFIFLLPFQIGRFVFSFAPLNSSFYHQVFIYLSDVLIVSLLWFCGWRVWNDDQERSSCLSAIKKDFLLILFFAISGLSIFVAGNKGLAIFHFIKLTEFILFYFYIRQNFKYFDIKKFSWIFISAALLQIFIAGLQFYFQQSVGLKYLGESPLSPLIAGVAKIDENSFKLIRSYGTFPHPNILAAFLIFAALMTHYIAANDALSNASFFCRMRHKKYAALMTHSVILSAILLGLFLTFSKIALASFVVIAILFIFLYLFCHSRLPSCCHSRENGNLDSINSSLDPRLREDDRKECGDSNIRYSDICKIFFITFIIFTSLFIIFNKEIFARFLEEQSVSQRIFYSNIAQKAISDNPLFGVGVGNFINYFYNIYPALPDWQYQPVHNLFLLITSETGIISGLLFIAFIAISIYRFLKNKNRQLFDWTIFFIFINFLILANFDHYFWTLQQGQILFWLILGILNSRNNI